MNDLVRQFGCCCCRCLWHVARKKIFTNKVTKDYQVLNRNRVKLLLYLFWDFGKRMKIRGLNRIKIGMAKVYQGFFNKKQLD